MKNEKIQEQLEKFGSLLNTDKIITKDDIKQIQSAIIGVLAIFKKETSELNEETKSMLDTVLQNIQSKHDEVLQKVEGTTSKSSKEIGNQLKEAQRLLEEVQAIKAMPGEDGKDADEEKIVKDVLSRIKLPEYKETVLDNRDQMVEKINSGDEKSPKINAKQIEGLPKFTREVVREIGAHGGAYETPIKDATTRRLFPKDASGAYLISSGSSLVITEVDGSPSGTPTTLKFSNGSVTDNGDGSFTIATGAGGGGDVSSNTTTTVDGEVALFSGTGGKTIKRATGSGLALLTSGVLSATLAPTGLTSITLAPTASPSYAAGKLVYDSDNESLTFFNNDSAVGMQIGQEEWIRVINNSGSTIANGAVVYISGASAGLPTIALARANAAATTIGAGLATESIANGATGYVTCIGVVHGLDTSGFAAGATVFISSAVAGALTSTAPTAPNYRYRVGIVGTSSATVGTIHVTPSTASLGNGTANQVFGMNNAGSAQEVKSIVGTASQVTVTHTANTITLSLPATINVATSGNAATATALQNARTLWGQSFDGTGNVTGSLTAVGNITGGASSMTIVAGTGNSRTLTLQTTTAGGVATTAVVIGADQSTTFSGTVALGANNLTMTGDIASSGSRVNAGYFKDLNVASNGTLTFATAGSKNITINQATMKFNDTSDGFAINLVGSSTTGANVTVTLPNLTGTVALTANKLSAFAATTSAELAGVISDETGSGALVFATSPTLVTPTLGVATATRLGIGAAADASRLLLVTGDVSGGVATIERTNASTNAVVGTMIIKGTSTGDMTDGFGSAFQFAIQDTAAVENLIANIRGLRGGADNTGDMDFSVYQAGSPTIFMALDGSANTINLSKPIVPLTNDLVALGSSSLSFSDLFLASGAVINIAASNWVATHTSGVLTVGTGDLRIGNNFTSGTSVATLAGAQTLTNKWLQPRTGNTTSSGTPTINTDSVDFYELTAQSVAITSFTTNLSGTPVRGQTLWIAITDNGTARAITWGASFESSGTVTLPTTTVISTRLDVRFVWNTATSKWRCVGTA